MPALAPVGHPQTSTIRSYSSFVDLELPGVEREVLEVGEVEAPGHLDRPEAESSGRREVDDQGRKHRQC